MHFTVPEEVLQILNILSDAGYDSYLVGGSVRDFCRGQLPYDFDLTTSALPEETVSIFRARGFTVIPTGIQHGTVTVLMNGIPFEITTFRCDGPYSDGRHPDTVSFVGTLEEDLARRDFTVNAMAWNPGTGLVDPFGGLSDLQTGILRCVGTAEKRFREDALRILRALRFSAQLGFPVEAETDAALRSLRGLLSKVAAERIQTELMKLLCAENAGDVLRSYPEVLAVWIPEILPCVGFCQNSRYHAYDVWNHTCKAVESAANIPVLRLSMLLHDIEKPACYTEDRLPEGQIRGHFYGHAAASAETAGRILQRLRFGNETIHIVRTLIAVHCDPLIPSEKSIKRFLSRLGEPLLRLLIQHHRADNLAQAPDIIPARLQALKEITEITDRIMAEAQCFSLKKLAVNGHDLIQLGIKEGPQIKVLLQSLLDSVINDTLPNEREALLQEVRKRLTMPAPLP